MALSVQLNGQQRTFEELAHGATLQDLVSALDLKADRIAVEVNGEIVARRDRDSTILASGDKIEIVHFVGGGAA